MGKMHGRNGERVHMANLSCSRKVGSSSITLLRNTPMTNMSDFATVFKPRCPLHFHTAYQILDNHPAAVAAHTV